MRGATGSLPVAPGGCGSSRKVAGRHGHTRGGVTPRSSVAGPAHPVRHVAWRLRSPCCAPLVLARGDVVRVLRTCSLC